MNKFPFFQHHAVKIIFQNDVSVDEALIDKTAELMIKEFNLKVVGQGKHKFANDGFTKFWTLSQSHLIIHSWPENNAIHVDLMTCSTLINTKNEIMKSLDSLPIKKIVAVDFEY